MSGSTRNLVICLKNAGYEVSLETRKLYVAIPDETAAKHRLLRVIDESGEDYLFPSSCFAPIDLPTSLRRAVLTAAA